MVISDLFRVFDYYVGRKGAIGCVVPWHGGVIVRVFVLCFLVFFYECRDLEAGVFMISDVFEKEIPWNSKLWPATPHLIISLYFLILRVCSIGVLPYRFCLIAHILIRGGLSFPFWVITFAVNFNPNWRLAWIKRVSEGNSFVVRVITIGSECVRVLIRPVTLAARVTLNAIVGSLVIKLVFSIVLGLLIPFGYRVYNLGVPILVRLAFRPLGFLFGVVEFCIMCLQATIFCTLLVSYLSEVIVKPE